MLNNVTLTLALLLGSALPASDGVAKPSCCVKRAYCCQIQRPCCRANPVNGEAVSAIPHVAALSKPSCCVKRAHCCRIQRSCCGRTLDMPRFASLT